MKEGKTVMFYQRINDGGEGSGIGGKNQNSGEKKRQKKVAKD